MNTHGFRSMLSRQNAAPFTIFFLLAVVVLCGLAGSTMQSSAKARVGNGHVNQRPFLVRAP